LSPVAIARMRLCRRAPQPQFCSVARAQIELCANSESVHQFLLDHLEKVVLLNDRVTLHGRVPYGKTDNEEHRLPFSISSEITREERYQDRRKCG
jgi:hypothetical protein